MDTGRDPFNTRGDSSDPLPIRADPRTTDYGADADTSRTFYTSLTTSICIGIVLAGIILFIGYKAYERYEQQQAIAAMTKAVNEIADKFKEESIEAERNRKFINARNRKQAEIKEQEIQRQRVLQSRPVITSCIVNGVKTFDDTGQLCQ